MAQISFNQSAFDAGVAKVEAAKNALMAIKAPQCVDAGDEVQASLQAQYDQIKASLVDGLVSSLETSITSLKNAGANYAGALAAILGSGE